MTRSIAASLYNADFFAWTQQQAEALRHLSSQTIGDSIDLEHVAEEIEALGKRDLREVTSLLTRLIEHLIKMDRAPDSRSIPHWRTESLMFQTAAIDAYAASMHRLIDMPLIWTRAHRLAALAMNDESMSHPSPSECPFGIDELFFEDLDLHLAVTKLRAARLASD